ncbi:MAG: glycosyltransferase family 9 protein [Candidatus Aminicenantes bacterium]|nr:glycosyltransferase family 9 protein [Candidatus Aminicenantes bacterium]
MNSSLTVKTSCVHFKGEKPCIFKRTCDGCPHFKTFGPKILILKCRAQGDVLRTTPILSGLKRAFPDSFITWVVDEETVDLLRDIPRIDRVLPLNTETALALRAQRFDLVYSLDKDPGLTGLAMLVDAPRKYGFGLNEHGNVFALTPAAAYALRLGVDDKLKFRVNKKTYQRMIFEASGLEYKKDDYVFVLADAHRRKASVFFEKNKVPNGRLNIGLNTGAGAKFTTKQWPEAHFLKLIPRLKKELKANVFLLGGPREKALNLRLARKAGVKVFDTGTDNSLLEFAGFLDRMDVVVCSDTLAMHLALALKKKTVVLFGPTCPQEIELYGRGLKLFAGTDCAPCYRQTCPKPVCMIRLSPGQVLQAVREVAGR